MVDEDEEPQTTPPRKSGHNDVDDEQNDKVEVAQVDPSSHPNSSHHEDGPTLSLKSEEEEEEEQEAAPIRSPHPPPQSPKPNSSGSSSPSSSTNNNITTPPSGRKGSASRRAGRRRSSLLGGLSSSSHHSTDTTTTTITTPRSALQTPSKRMSQKLADRFHKFEHARTTEPDDPATGVLSFGSPTREQTHVLSATGRKRTVGASLQTRVQAFTPRATPKSRPILLSPKEVKQLVKSSTTNQRLKTIQKVFQQRGGSGTANTTSKTVKESQRQVILGQNAAVRRQQWIETRAKFGKAVDDYHKTSLRSQVKTTQKVVVVPHVPSNNNKEEEDHEDILTHGIEKFRNVQLQQPQKYKKTPAQEAKIRTVVETHFAFSSFRPGGRARTSDSLEILVNAFEIVKVDSTQPQSSTLWYQEDDPTKQAFYIVDHGSPMGFYQDGTLVSTAKEGDAFGEESLIHGGPSGVTVSILVDAEHQGGGDAASAAQTTTTLLCLKPRIFRGLLQYFASQAQAEKYQLLRQVDFLKDLFLEASSSNNDHQTQDELLQLLASILTRVEFDAHQTWEAPNVTQEFLLVQSGVLSIGTDLQLQANDYLGENVLMGNLVAARTTHSTMLLQDATMTGVEAGVFYRLHQERLEAVVGSKRLQNLKTVQTLVDYHPLRNTKHNSRSKRRLAKQIKQKKLSPSNPTLKVDKTEAAALYIVQQGSVTVKYDDGRQDEVKRVGDVFGSEDLHDDDDGDAGETKMSDGEDVLMTPKPKSGGKSKLRRSRGFTATMDGEEAMIGVLPVQNHEDALLFSPMSVASHTVSSSGDDNFLLSPSSFSIMGPSRTVSAMSTLSNEGALELRQKVSKAVATDMELSDFERIKLLGEGMYGEVWLVAADVFKMGGQVQQQFALKSQLKDDETRGKQALIAIQQEIDAMKALNHAQIVDLVHTFEDEEHMYMLMGLLPGGELWDRIYQEFPNGDIQTGISEEHAKFYAYSIADTLSYIHSKKYAFRDLKPENIMLDNDGYPVLVDFGFAKYIEDKTYTFCGTPNYCAPEVILNAGHNRSVDHWALGVTIYEMVAGENPFFFEGMETMALYDAICQEPAYPLKPEDGRSPALIDLLDKMLEKDPTHRLGMLAGGMNDIMDHPWFEDLDTLRVRFKRYKAPWKPEQDEDEDTQKFMQSSMAASFANLEFMNNNHSLDDSLNSLHNSTSSFHEPAIAEEDEQVNSDDEENGVNGGDAIDTTTDDDDDDEAVMRGYITTTDDEAVITTDDDEAASIEDTGMEEVPEDEKLTLPLTPSLDVSTRSGMTRSTLSGEIGVLSVTESEGDVTKSPKSTSSPKKKGKKKKAKEGGGAAGSSSPIKSPKQPSIRPTYRYFDSDDPESQKAGYHNPVPNPNRRRRTVIKKDKEGSKTRRSAISGALAGLGIDGSDEEL